MTEYSQNDPPPHNALIGLVFIGLLIVGGLLLVHVLKNMSQEQDCAMQGRTNCAPIDSSTR